MGDGFVDIANVLSSLCKDYGKTVRFVLFYTLLIKFGQHLVTLKRFKNTDFLVCFTIIFPISKLVTIVVGEYI